jgi:hypothetical protein
MQYRLGLVLPFLVGGCLTIDQNGPGIAYDLTPQEFTQDFGNSMGTVADVDCSMGGDALCAMAPAPMGTTAVCDMTSYKCTLHSDVRLSQTINLSQQNGFPSSVASSSAVKSVSVSAVHYWTPSNTLTFPSPPIDLYVGSQSAQSENDPGVAHLGQIGSLPPGGRTSCHGAVGTEDSKCDVALDPAGIQALSTLAADYRTPFNVLVVAHMTVKSGDPVPAGKIDLFVQPAIAFHIN